jgi:hypothetical protein
MNKIVKRFIITVALSPLIIVFLYFGLNYIGFCFEQCRFLSDEEKIDGAIGVVLARMYTIRDENGTYYPDPEYNIEYLKPKKNGKYIIFSEDINNFKTENPNCCTFSKALYREKKDYYFYISLRSRIFGLASDFVTVKFKYRDLNGEEKIDSDMVAISNCGEYKLSINEAIIY